MTRDALSGLWARGAPSWPSTPRAWHDLLGQARVTQMSSRLAMRCADELGWDGVEPGPRPYLQSALAIADRQVQEVRWEVAQLQRAMRNVDSRVVLLKGAAYLMAELPPSQGRTFSDIDILMARERLTATEQALFVAGWIPKERDPYNDRYYRAWMHELPPLSHITRGTAIDVHHTITPPTSAFNVDGASLLAHARPLPAHRGLWVLQPVDMVLHSAVHLFGEGEFDHGFRDLMDMDRLLQHFARVEPDFWHALFVRAGELKLQVPLHHALFHVNRLFGTQAPAAMRDRVRALQPAWLTRTLMAAMLRIALRPNHPSCRVRGEGLVRWLLYVRSHWLRMPVRLLVPHLVRKAWMSRFPAKPKPPVVPT